MPARAQHAGAHPPPLAVPATHRNRRVAATFGCNAVAVCIRCGNCHRVVRIPRTTWAQSSSQGLHGGCGIEGKGNAQGGGSASERSTRACMFGATAAAVVALLMVAAPDTGTLAGASRLAQAPEMISGGQSGPSSASTSAPTPMPPTWTGSSSVSGRLPPGSTSTSTPTATSTSNPTSPSAPAAAHAPEKLYGRQPASTSASTSISTSTSEADADCQGTTPLGLPGNVELHLRRRVQRHLARTRTNWVPQETAASGYLNGATACYVDNPDTISVSGGYLNLTARQVAPFTCADGSNSFTTSYEAGMVSTEGLFDQTYGAFEVSAKLPPSVVEGLQETMWLYPQNVDLRRLARLGRDRLRRVLQRVPGPRRALHPLLAVLDRSRTPRRTTASSTRTRSTRTASTGRRRRSPCSTTARPASSTTPSTGSEPFDQPFFIALTQALGVGTNAFTPSVTELPATTQIDWVRAWAPASG